MGFWYRNPTINRGMPRYAAAAAGPTSHACFPALGALPVGNTNVGPTAQPNPVSLGSGQLEMNRSNSSVSANSVIVELLCDVASVRSLNVGVITCLKGRNERGSTGSSTLS